MARSNTNTTPDTDAQGNVLIANEVENPAPVMNRTPNPTSAWTKGGQPALAPTSTQLGFLKDLDDRAKRMDETNKDAEGYEPVASANLRFAGEALSDPTDRVIHDALVLNRETGELRVMTGVTVSQKIASYQGEIRARISAGFTVGAAPAGDPGAAAVTTYVLDEDGNVVAKG